MFVVAKDRNEIFNLDFVTNIYESPDYTIKAAISTGGTRGGVLGKYHNQDEMQRAMNILINEINMGRTVCMMPQDDKVREIQTHTEDHYINGGKIKRVGGS